MKLDGIKLLYCACLSFFLISCGVGERIYVVQSPDGKISLTTGMDEGRPYYELKRGTEAVIARSYLGFKLKDSDFSNDFRIKVVKRASHDETWQQPWGEEIEVHNHYNELAVLFEERGGLHRELSLTFRMFNDGVGFRYAFPKQKHLKDFVIMDEQTEFALPWDAKAWSIPTYGTKYYEALYTATPISRKDTVSTPLTIMANDSLYLALHEANLTNYAGLNLALEKGKKTTLRAVLTPWSTGEKVFASTPFCSPWRTIIVGRKPADLILSRLMLNLNEPSKIENTSWIDPGRYIGIWWGMHMEKYTWAQGPKHGATTTNTMRYIDFAAKHGFSGVLVEGWNWGWDGDWTAHGDLFSFTHAYPDFNLKRITEYARSKGVKLIGHHETGGATLNYEAQMDGAYTLYRSLGVNVVKTGYVNPLLDNKEQHSSQYGVRHYRKVIETAARYGIMIDNHEPVMPTGLQRTYPNLMTQEGMRGQEYDAWSPDGGNPPDHTCIIPFTRGLAGPMDFTPGTFNFVNTVHPGTRVQTTLAKQLALNVVLFSPLQMASDMIENYENQPAFSFITSCPTTWARTVVPDAKIGEYIVIARKDRRSENWFIGCITNEKARAIELSLDFLDNGSTYKATLYCDGDSADSFTNPYPVVISEREVNAGTVLLLNLKKGGGAAIRVEKI